MKAPLCYCRGRLHWFYTTDHGRRTIRTAANGFKKKIISMETTIKEHCKSYNK